MTDARWKSFYDKMVAAGVVKAGLDYKRAYTLQFVNKGVGDLREELTKTVFRDDSPSADTAVNLWRTRYVVLSKDEVIRPTFDRRAIAYLSADWFVARHLDIVAMRGVEKDFSNGVRALDRLRS